MTEVLHFAVTWCECMELIFLFFFPLPLRYTKRWLQTRWRRITLGCSVDVGNPSKWQNCLIIGINLSFFLWALTQGQGPGVCRLRRTGALHWTSQYNRCFGKRNKSTTEPGLVYVLWYIILKLISPAVKMGPFFDMLFVIVSLPPHPLTLGTKEKPDLHTLLQVPLSGARKPRISRWNKLLNSKHFRNFGNSPPLNRTKKSLCQSLRVH